MGKGMEQITFLPEEVFSFEIERTDEPLIAEEAWFSRIRWHKP